MAGDVYNSNGNGRSPNTAYRGQRDYSVMPRSPSEALEPERAPEPPHGSRQGRQRPVVVFFSRLLTFFLVLLPTVAGLFFLIRQQFDRPGPINYPTVFVVAKGEGVSTIARRLEQDGIINSDSLLPGRWIFLIASRRFGVHDKIKAGEFHIKANASVRDILDTLVEGKSAKVIPRVNLSMRIKFWKPIFCGFYFSRETLQKRLSRPRRLICSPSN